MASMHSIIKKHSVRLGERSPESAPRDGERAPRTRGVTRRCEKSVQLLRVDGVVQAIEFTCSCGETTVVELELPAPRPSPLTTPES